MRPVTLIPIALTVVMCAACGGAPTSQQASTEPSVPPPSTSPPPPEVSSPSAAASVVASELTCSDFDFAAPRLATQVKHIGGFVGFADNGASDVQVNLGQAKYEMDVLVAKAPECAPKAVQALGTLAGALDGLLVTFQTGDDPAIVAADKAALDEVRSRGIAAWKIMKINPVGWEGIFANAR